MAEAQELQAPVGEFSEPKRKLLWHLKILQQAGLEELAKKMRISRMAVHKHLANLTERGLVESTQERRGVGRPRLLYRLTDRSKNLFPRTYGTVALCALQFIEQKLGRKGVEQMLRSRQADLFKEYYDRLQPLTLDGRVRELAHIRDQEGYMAEPKKLPSGKYQILEHNCPIIQIAQNYWEACSTERELFENLLGASVETTHRAAKGDLVCRFVIDPKQTKGQFK